MKIKKEEKKVYSAREAMKFLPQVASEPTLRKILKKDLENNNSLGVIIQQIGKQKRYFIPSLYINKLVETY